MVGSMKLERRMIENSFAIILPPRSDMSNYLMALRSNSRLNIKNILRDLKTPRLRDAKTSKSHPMTSGDQKIERSNEESLPDHVKRDGVLVIMVSNSSNLRVEIVLKWEVLQVLLYQNLKIADVSLQCATQYGIKLFERGRDRENLLVRSTIVTLS
jgi:hypothetical protein